MFSLLNFISGFLEVGSVLFGMKHFGVVGALIGALCYQIGNIVPDPFRISKRMCINFLLIAALGMVSGIRYPVFVLIAMPFLAMVLQSARECYKNAKEQEKVNLKEDAVQSVKPDWKKMKKRFTRIAGFPFGFGLNALTGLACVIILLIEIARKNSNEKSKLECPHFNRFDWILVLHEIHYFIYCYSMLIYVYMQTGMIAAAFLFFASWVLYVISPVIYSKLDSRFKSFKITFMIGHLGLTALLVSLFFVPDFWEKMVIWILTGIGGTTEYCIEKLEKQHGSYVKNYHNSAENLGHILGIMLCILLYFLSHNVLISVLAASLFAFSALVIMACIMKKEGSHESMRKGM